MSAYELVLIDLWSFLTNLEAKVQIFTINLDFNIDWPSTRFENSEVHFFGDDTGTQKTEISIFELDWHHICRNWIQQNQKSSRSNHFRFWKFWWLTKMSPIWQCHQKCDHWHEFLSESTPEAHSAPNNRLFAQTWSSIRNSRTKPIPGKIDKSRTDYPVSTQYHLDTSPGLDK